MNLPPSPRNDSGAVTAQGGGPLFLIVDDDRTNRLVLRSMLRQQGYEAVEAADGREGVQRFQEAAPDVVLMDVMMPEMDGYEATRRIKALAGDRYIPVIFLTALTDDQALARCLEVGGDDFISKPFSRVLLKAKIDTHLRARAALVTILHQRDQLAAHQRHLHQEQEVAERLFRTFVRTGHLESDHIRYLLSPMSVFNGDMLVAARTPSGARHVMLGDFTGHGLPSAIGALPAAEIFYSMTAKGFTISDIAGEINHKLRLLLPTSMFCAATLVSLDHAKRILSVWNAGLPDLLLASRRRGLHTRLPSRHLPLGIVPDSQFDPEVQRLELDSEDFLYIYSDGVIETINEAQEMFGQERLNAVFAGPGNGGFFQDILDQLAAFRGEMPQRDDTTLIEIACRPEYVVATTPDAAPVPAATATNWQLNLELDATTIRHMDPLPLLIQALMELQGLSAHREKLYTVLSELVTNAIDHGLLELDSRTKHTPHGFSQYYVERDRRLALLDNAWVRVDLEHAAVHHGGRLTIRVEDSGRGFDPLQVRSILDGNLHTSGRGLALIRSLCADLRFYGRNNIVEAIYLWGEPEPAAAPADPGPSQ